MLLTRLKSTEDKENESTEIRGDKTESSDRFHFIPSCLYNPFGGYLYNAVYILWTIIDPVPTLILGIFS